MTRSLLALTVALMYLGVTTASAAVVFDERTFGRTTGAEPTAIETFDLDGDGDLDVLAAARSTDQIKLWRAQPAPGAEPPSTAMTTAHQSVIPREPHATAAPPRPLRRRRYEPVVRLNTVARLR